MSNVNPYRTKLVEEGEKPYDGCDERNRVHGNVSIGNRRCILKEGSFTHTTQHKHITTNKSLQEIAKSCRGKEKPISGNALNFPGQKFERNYLGRKKLSIGSIQQPARFVIDGPSVKADCLSMDIEYENKTKTRSFNGSNVGNEISRTHKTHELSLYHATHSSTKSPIQTHPDQILSAQWNGHFLRSDINSEDENDSETCMEIDEPVKPPLVVIDGANVAYSYADAIVVDTFHQQHAKIKEPKVVGIALAVQYFKTRNLRVIVVLPMQWMRKKPLADDLLQDNSMMQTDDLDLLKKLKSEGLLCLCPPTDDDDAYIINIAQNDTSQANGGYILSCDLFRDAARREPHLREWLKEKRISFTFFNDCNTYGTFVPNPTHELIQRYGQLSTAIHH